MGKAASAAYSGMRTFIDMASQCYKPSEMSEQQALAKSMIDQIRTTSELKNKAAEHQQNTTGTLSQRLCLVLLAGLSHQEFLVFHHHIRLYRKLQSTGLCFMSTR